MQVEGREQSIRKRMVKKRGREGREEIKREGNSKGEEEVKQCLKRGGKG